MRSNQRYQNFICNSLFNIIRIICKLLQPNTCPTMICKFWYILIYIHNFFSCYLQKNDLLTFIAQIWMQMDFICKFRLFLSIWCRKVGFLSISLSRCIISLLDLDYGRVKALTFWYPVFSVHWYVILKCNGAFVSFKFREIHRRVV